MLPEHAYLHGKPEAKGLLRSQMSDFKVFEQLPFTPMGEGEHLYIKIKKTGANTVFVARELAKYFKVKENLVSYAGLKDRFAVAEQWFGVHVPGKKNYDLSDLVIDGVEVLEYDRHNKKLRTGALTGNNFELTLRNVDAVEKLVQRWQEIITHGVPNYFGEQRFGIDGGNIERALSLFSGAKVKDKKKRGMYLSAARSYIFNSMINERIKQSLFDKIIEGDVLMLAGSQSVFHVEGIDSTVNQRLIDKDVDITAPMWGAGALLTTKSALIFEQSVAEQHSEFTQGLPKFGLKQERRRARLNISNTDLAILSSENNLVDVKINFFLPAGCYATTVLRELLVYQDMTTRVDMRQVNTEG